jgi:lysophospholipase L1-like esterase
MKKTVLINLGFIVVLIVIIEMIFGYWFKANNFGIYARSQRNVRILVSTEHSGKKTEHLYKRNFYAFRGDEFNPKDVEIIFMGGSTGNQRYTPENLSIVGKLNSFLEKDNINKKIYNASTDGQSTRGYVNNFLYWFTKIPNFKPKVFIFYSGINDSKCCPKWARHYDFKVADKTILRVRDYAKNNSILLELFKKMEDKYFPKMLFGYIQPYKKSHEDYEFIDFNKAQIKYSKDEINEKQKKMLISFQKNLQNLKIQINKYNAKPIFITQVQYDGNGDNNVFLINKELKKFSKKNNYALIALDETITDLNKTDFYDGVHTTFDGSNKIAKIIYPQLLSNLKIILKDLN